MASAVTRCVFISAFTSSVCILVGIASSTATIKACVVTAEIKKYKSVIKKKKKHDKVALPAKKNTIKVLISKALVDSNISHDRFVSVNNVLKEYSNNNKYV